MSLQCRHIFWGTNGGGVGGSQSSLFMFVRIFVHVGEQIGDRCSELTTATLGTEVSTSGPCSSIKTEYCKVGCIYAQFIQSRLGIVSVLLCFFQKPVLYNVTLFFYASHFYTSPLKLLRR